MTAFAYIALGAGLMLVADIIRTGWISRHDALRRADETQSALGSRRQLEAVAASETGRRRSEAIAALFTAAPRVMTDGEVRRINRRLRRG